MDLKIDIYRSFSPELEKLWRSFEKETSWSPFQTFGWLSLWHKTIGKPLHNIEPQIFIVSKNQIAIAILPTGIRKVYGIKILEWLGGIHSDYMGPLLHLDFYSKVDLFDNLWKEIKKIMSPIDIVHFRRQPMILGNIGNPFISNFRVIHTDNAYKANLYMRWDDFYCERIKKKMRADSNRQLLRLKEKGKLEFKIAESIQEKSIIIKNMIEQKSQRYRDTGIADMLAIEQHRDFYNKLVDLDLGDYNLSCSSLMVNDNPIATHVGVVNNNCFYYLMPANLSGEWQVFSPGRLLLENLLRWSVESGFKTFDFTVGSEQYKKNWCDEEMKLFEYLEPINFKGRCYSLFQYLLLKLKSSPKTLRMAVSIRHTMRKVFLR